MVRLRVILCLIFLLGPTLPPAPVIGAESSKSGEYTLKAAFLYNFAKFVEWPTETLERTESFKVGLLGKDPFGKELDELMRGKTVHNKPLVVQRLESLEAAADCQMIFISASEADRLEEILKTLAGRPVLVVGDMPRFIHRGGMVGLSVENQKVRFSINEKPADAAGLKISSQLLKLAKMVKKAED